MTLLPTFSTKYLPWYIAKVRPDIAGFDVTSKLVFPSTAQALMKYFMQSTMERTVTHSAIRMALCEDISMISKHDPLWGMHKDSLQASAGHLTTKSATLERHYELNSKPEREVLLQSFITQRYIRPAEDQVMKIIRVHLAASQPPHEPDSDDDKDDKMGEVELSASVKSAKRVAKAPDSPTSSAHAPISEPTAEPLSTSEADLKTAPRKHARAQDKSVEARATKKPRPPTKLPATRKCRNRQRSKRCLANGTPVYSTEDQPNCNTCIQYYLKVGNWSEKRAKQYDAGELDD